MSLTQFLTNRCITDLEGNIEQVPKQKIELIELSKNIHNAMEIGFNAGHSAEVFLKHNTSLNLTSFDLGSHGYVLNGKEYIDMMFPGRHTLIIGDSRVSIPKFIKDHPETKFDLLFIDGGHEYEIAKADLENCRYLAHKDSVFIMDDTLFSKDYYDYNIGPTKAILEAKEKGIIKNVRYIDFQAGRGMTIGNYVLDNL